MLLIPELKRLTARQESHQHKTARRNKKVLFPDPGACVEKLELWNVLIIKLDSKRRRNNSKPNSTDILSNL